jgi:hypothetical protein
MPRRAIFVGVLDITMLPRRYGAMHHKKILLKG